MMQLSYISKSNGPVTPSLVIDLLEAARRNNAPMGVSGLLYGAQGQFAQCLEGEVDVVESVFARIAADERHEILSMQRHEGKAERAFSDWAMAYIDTSNAEVARVMLNHDTNSYEPTKWRENDILPLLVDLGRSLRAARIKVTY